jgi:hypothetical protein
MKCYLAAFSFVVVLAASPAVRGDSTTIYYQATSGENSNGIFWDFWSPIEPEFSLTLIGNCGHGYAFGLCVEGQNQVTEGFNPAYTDTHGFIESVGISASNCLVHGVGCPPAGRTLLSGYSAAFVEGTHIFGDGHATPDGIYELTLTGMGSCIPGVTCDGHPEFFNPAWDGIGPVNTFVYHGSNPPPVSTPEPASLLLLGSGILGVGYRVKKKSVG